MTAASARHAHCDRRTDGQTRTQIDARRIYAAHALALPMCQSCDVDAADEETP